MAWSLWWVYLLASVGLSLTPGPNSLLVLTHGALHGHRRTLFTVAGGATGFTLLIGLSMLGIGALLQASASALTLLKWLGGAYLVWLGVQLWRAPAITLVADAGAPHAAGSALFRQGLLTAISNPKALVFFTVFLPPFINLHHPILPQIVRLATIGIAIEVVALAFYGLLAYRLGQLAVTPAAGRRIGRTSGSILMAIAAAMALSQWI